ncbi:N-acyl amino acid synthase FeeM domain-containing protein [Rhodocyclaceae bacterium SMB388]
MLETYATPHRGAIQRHNASLESTRLDPTARSPANTLPPRLRLEVAHGKPWLQASAAALVRRMYASRGLQIHPDSKHPPGHCITLAARADHEVLGTLTLRIDGEHGLLADELYRREIQTLREAGAVLCEATRLALKPQPQVHTDSHDLLTMLFNAAFAIARGAHRCTDLIMECHPRHANYYQRMLACERIGAAAICPRVGAPAVLLRLSLEQVERRIDRHHQGESASARDLYRRSLSPQAQRALCQTLLTQH